jgi:hypothetical protein
MWELGEPHMNHMGTHWVHIGKKNKKFVPKNWTPTECMVSLPIGCMKLLFSQLFVTIFGLG